MDKEISELKEKLQPRFEKEVECKKDIGGKIADLYIPDKDLIVLFGENIENAKHFKRKGYKVLKFENLWEAEFEIIIFKHLNRPSAPWKYMT